MNHKKAQGFQDTAWNTLGTFFYFLCQWLLTVLAVRLAGYEDAGVFSLVISIANIFYCFSIYGIRNFQVADIQERFSDREYLQARHASTLASLLLFAVCIWFLNVSFQTRLCCWIYIFYKYAESYTDVLFGFFQKQHLYPQIALSYILKGILTLITFCIGLAWMHSLPWALALNTLCLLLVMVLYDYPLVRKGLTKPRHRSRYHCLFGFCFPLMLYSLMVPALNFITRYAVEQRFGEEKLGYFSSVTMVLSVLMVMMNSVFVTLIPDISMNYAQKNFRRLKRLLWQALGGFVLLWIGVQVAGSLLGPFCFSLVFGQEILPYMYLLAPTIACGLILAAVTFYSAVLTSFQKNSLVLAGNLVGVLACFVSVFFCTANWGMSGALYSMIGGLSLSLILVLGFCFYCVSKGEQHEQAGK